MLFAPLLFFASFTGAQEAQAPVQHHESPQPSTPSALRVAVIGKPLHFQRLQKLARSEMHNILNASPRRWCSRILSCLPPPQLFDFPPGRLSTPHRYHHIRDQIPHWGPHYHGQCPQRPTLSYRARRKHFRRSQSYPVQSHERVQFDHPRTGDSRYGVRVQHRRVGRQFIRLQTSSIQRRTIVVGYCETTMAIWFRASPNAKPYEEYRRPLPSYVRRARISVREP